MLIIGDGDGHLGRLAITNAELDVVQYQMASIAAFVTNLRCEYKVCIGGSGIVQVVIGQLRQNGRGEGVNLRCATFRHHRISQVVHKQPDVGIATNIFHLVAFHYGIGFIARGQRVAVAAGKGGAQVVERERLRRHHGSVFDIMKLKLDAALDIVNKEFRITIGVVIERFTAHGLGYQSSYTILISVSLNRIIITT